MNAFAADRDEFRRSSFEDGADNEVLTQYGNTGTASMAEWYDGTVSGGTLIMRLYQSGTIAALEAIQAIYLNYTHASGVGSGVGLMGFTNVSDDPPEPPANAAWVFLKSDVLYIIDSGGTVSAVGAGSAVGALGDLTDVTDSTPTLSNVLQADGSNWTSSEMDHSDLDFDDGVNPHGIAASDLNAVTTNGTHTISGQHTYSILPESSVTPSDNDDLVRKGYTDSVAAGLRARTAVRLASTADVDISTELENTDNIDSVALVTGDRVLLKDQTDASENGVYIASASGAASRSTDFDEYNANEVYSGSFFTVTEGTVNSEDRFVLTTPNPITVDTTDLDFTYHGTVEAYTAGDAIGITALDIDWKVKSDGGLQVTSDEAEIKLDGASLATTASGLSTSAVPWADVLKAGSLFNDLGNVNTAGVSDGQVMKYDLGTTTWLPANDSTAVADAGGDVIVSIPFSTYSRISSTVTQWNNFPSSAGELFNNAYGRKMLDLSAATQYRVVASMFVAGSSGSDVNLHYSSDNITFQVADAGGGEGECVVDVGGNTFGNWTDLVAGAKINPCYLAIKGKDGNDATDPRFAWLAVQFKFPYGALTDEQVQDKVGAMVSGNTEDYITVTYQDGDGTIDFSVSTDFSAATSFLIPAAADVSGYITNGLISWDNDDFILYIGNGTTVIPMGGGAETVNELLVNYTAPSDASSEFSAVDVQLDVSSLAATSEVHGVNIAAVGSTSGEITGVGVHTGVRPIHQHTGTFATPSQTEYAGEIPSGGSWSDGIDGNTIFEADDDEIYIGDAAKFGELEVLLATAASQDEIIVAEYQHTDLSWDAFVPSDGTNGFTQNGLIEWDSASLTSWKSDSDPAGADGSSGYWIRIRRTRNAVVTDPIVTTIKTLEPTEYGWDEDGDLSIGALVADDNITLDKDAGDSPQLKLTDGDDNNLIIKKNDSGSALFQNDEGGLNFKPSNDEDDYFRMSTASDEPTLTSVGTTSMNYGDATVTDHTFLSDSTGDAEFVVPNDSIGPDEIDWANISTVDFVDIKYIPFEFRNGIPENNLGSNGVDIRQYRDGERAYLRRIGIGTASDVDSDQDVWIQIPADWGSWYGGDNIVFDVRCSARANGAITLTVYDDAGDADDGVTGDDIEPGSDATWTAISGVRLTETDYDQGDWVRLHIDYTDVDTGNSYDVAQGHLIYVPE
jgi:hypothetical protein